MESSHSKAQVAKRLVCQTGELSTCGGKDLKMETSARDRKRDSARKKSEFSVYSQKAVRAKEQQHAVGQKVQRAKPVVVQKSNDNGPYGPIGQQRAVGQKLCAARLKDAAKQKEQLKK